MHKKILRVTFCANEAKMNPGDIVKLLHVYKSPFELYDDPFKHFKSDYNHWFGEREVAILLKSETFKDRKYGEIGTYARLLTSRNIIGWINVLDIEVVE